MRSKTIPCAGLLCALLAVPGSAGAQSLRGPTSPQDQLKLQLDDTTLRISGGGAFDPCAILLGLEKQTTSLPGGAVLRISPLAMLVRGTFDAQGAYSIDIARQLDLLTDPILILAQAITVIHDSEHFGTSNVLGIGMITNGDIGSVGTVVLEPDVPPVQTEPDVPPVQTEPDVPPVQTEPDVPPVRTEPDVPPVQTESR